MALSETDAAWIVKAAQSAEGLSLEQCRELVAIVEDEGGFTPQARQRLAFLLDDESWGPSVEEVLAAMAACERWERYSHLMNSE